MFFRSVFLFLLSGILLSGETLRWAGTDFLSDHLVASLGEWAGEEITLEVQRSGSLPAKQAWAAGELEAKLILSAGEESLDYGREALVFTVAYVVPRVVVHQNSPLEEVSFELLNRIFASGSANPIVRWEQIPGFGEDRLRTVQPMVQSLNEHLSPELFRQMILGGDDFRANVQKLPGESLLSVIRDNIEAIAVTGQRVEPGMGVRILPIRAVGEEFGFIPSPENVQEGDYPFAIPLQLVVRRNAVSPQKALLEKVLGDDAVEYWQAHGWEEAPRTLRVQNLRRLAEADG